MLRLKTSALFIGRFQPFQNGHLWVIKEILKKHRRVIIVIGSAEKNYLRNNPLTASERFQLIEATLQEAKIPAEKYCIIPIRNINNYALWVNHVNTYVPPYSHLYTGSGIVKACYDNQYNVPNSPKIGPEIITLKRKLSISATKIREAIIKNDPIWKKMVPKAVANLLNKWHFAERIQTIQDTMDETKYHNSY